MACGTFRIEDLIHGTRFNERALIHGTRFNERAQTLFTNLIMKTSDAAWATCPLTGQPLVEPLIDYEGNTYEKEAILEWLKTNPTSPITRHPLAANQLFPNRALKDLIRDDASLPSTVNLSPLASSDEEDSNTNELSELARKVSVDIGVCKAVNGSRLLRVKVPDDSSERHLPASIVCVVDESYSMDDAAKTQEDQEGNSGLSLLDIVKHACKTVIETLGPEDELALVSYANSAQVKLPFMKMTAENKLKAAQVVESLHTRGSTNLWDGLLQAMELTSELESTVDIFLLTDGLPNLHPPRGELPTFERYKTKRARWNCRISTFGFGYSLDSKLLNDIAIKGDGQYCFIPDSSFVGTVFINATSNVLSTAVNSVVVTIDEENNPKICDSNDSQSLQDIFLSLPSLCYGQSLDVLDDRIPADGEKGNLTLGDLHVAQTRESLVSMIRSAEERFANCDAKTALTLAQSDAQNLIGEIEVIAEGLSSSEKDVEQKLLAIKADLVGQITEAYSRVDWHDKWGRHYLLSLARAHELQRCTNFKDPGLQVYATEKFSTIRDMSEDVFCKLPPPKPSRRRNNINYTPVSSMSTYYNANSGCLARGNIRMADGRFIPVSQVSPGDMLQSSTGPVKVRCVVTIPCVDHVQALVALDGGVLVTPWHPVRMKGATTWTFPADLGPIKWYSCAKVHNFILEGNGTSVPIGPFEAISLGHGVTDDPVAKHDYFGSSKVVQDLSNMVGWDQGRVQLAPNLGRRDPESGLITSFVQKIDEIDIEPKSLHTTKVNNVEVV